MRLLIISILLGITCTGFSQQMTYSDSAGSVVVNKDARLDILSAKQSEINRRAMLMNITHARGYRIQVINTQNRDKANEVKADMLRRFPEHKSYLLYKAPNFRVRVGNFLTQKEAEATRKMIMSLYPGVNMFLISEMVEYTPKEEDDLSRLD